MKTNAELSSLVAEHVAGYKWDRTVFHDPPMRFLNKPDHEWQNAGPAEMTDKPVKDCFRLVPYFSTSVDECLPYLEALFEWVKIERIYTDRPFIWQVTAREKITCHESLPRCICLALLRAHGVEVED